MQKKKKNPHLSTGHTELETIKKYHSKDNIFLFEPIIEKFFS
jgi:hypothetical protein